eukprot:COSAG04_NODE_6018_length_1431_cov_0.930180_3_plen_51_part_01
MAGLINPQLYGGDKAKASEVEAGIMAEHARAMAQRGKEAPPPAALPAAEPD